MEFVRRRASSRFSSCSKFTEPDTDKRRTTMSTLCSIPFSRQTSVSFNSSNAQSQWEILMRKFSTDYKKNDHRCHIQVPDLDEFTCESRPLKQFTTGSSYQGTWDELGICGYGIYTFPNGVVYRGEFEDNMFHGNGEMEYPDGIVLRGKWNYGELIDKTIVFADGVHYQDHNWEYCKAPDRRFSKEYKEGVQPAGNSIMTSEPDRIKDPPDGMFDVGDGFYDPVSGSVIDYEDRSHIIRCIHNDLKPWIEANCRTALNAPIGPQPDLYRSWQDITLKLPATPYPMCISDEESDNTDSEQDLRMSSSSMWKMSLSSWIKRSRFRFDPLKQNVDLFRLRQKERSPSSVSGSYPSQVIQQCKTKPDDTEKKDECVK